MIFYGSLLLFTPEYASIRKLSTIDAWGISSAGSAEHPVSNTSESGTSEKSNSPESRINKGFSNIWGYSSAGSASTQVCDPSTMRKAKKLNSPEVQ